MYLKNILCIVLCSILCCFADGKVKVTDSGSGYDVELCNETNTPLIVQGYRLESEATKVEPKSGGTTEESSSKTSVYPSKVWQHDVKIPHDIATSACRAKEALSYDTKGTLLESGSQLLVQTGTCNGRFGYPDGGVFSCVEVDREIAKSKYYQSDLCLSNDLGKNAGSVSGGWINTWGKNTQIQYAYPTGVNVNLTAVSWLPQTNKNSPFYAMSLATVQEIFGMESQYLMAASMKETWLGTTGGHTYASQAVKTSATPSWISGFGNNLKAGPVHMTTEELVRVIQAYPQFFPEHTCASTVTDANDVDNACSLGDDKTEKLTEFYLLNKGSDIVAEDSPLLFNSYVAVGLNLHFIFDKMRLSTDLCFADLLANGKDKEAALKILPGLYRNPETTQEIASLKDPAILTNPDVSDKFYEGALSYRDQILPVVDKFVAASKSSEACGGSAKIFDIAITRQHVQDFFFGTGGSVASQGEGGVLLHFDKSTGKRQELSDNLDCIFDKLKGKAKTAGVATTADDEISFRYDFLTLLRVAKSSLSDGWPLDRGFPRQQSFKKYVEDNSQGTTTCTGANIDTQYPWFSISSPVLGAEVKPGFDMTVAAEDDITKEVHIEYTFSEKWAGWVNATVPPSGDAYSFQVDCSVEGYPKEGETKDLWVRISDDCNNSVVQKHSVKANNELCGPPKVTPAPVTAVLTDENGDGIADKLVIDFDNEFEDGLPDSTSLSWPNDTTKSKLVLDSTMIDASVKSRINKVGDITQIVATGGTGELVVYYTDRRGNVKTFSIAITEKMGPVISRAYKLDAAGTQDSLLLIFSEEIASPSDVVKALLGQTASQPSFPLDKVTVITQKEGNKYLVVLPIGILESGDKLRFAPIEDGGVIEDTNGNKVHKDNPWVEISLVGKLLVPVQGSFLDTNEDGKLDRVVVTYFDELTSNSPKVAQLEFFWPNASGEVIRWVPPISELTVDGKSLIWTPHDTTKLHPEKTGIEEGYGQASHAQGIQEESGEIRDTTIAISMADKMKPVILRGTLNQSNTFETKPDTVTLYLSEAVAKDSISNILEVAKFKRGSNVEDSFVPQKTLFRSNLIRLYFGPGTEVKVRPNLGDSVALLAGDGFIQDLAQNPASLQFKELTGKGGARWFSKSEHMNFIPNPDEQKVCKAEALPIGLDIDEYRRNDSLPSGVIFSIPLVDGDDFDAENYTLKWSFEHFTNLGSFVSKCAKLLRCNSSMFEGGDCRGRTVHLMWNGLDQSKSPVYSGVFIRKFNYIIEESKGASPIKGDGENNIGILRR